VVHMLTEFQGKKILVVELPVIISDDNAAFLGRLDSVSRAYQDQLVVIGVLSYDDGYTDSAAQSLQDWYHSIMGTQILITTGIYTHRDAVDQQPLFFWLTHMDQNGHFDEDVGGINQKYFISETGDLFGVIGPETGLTDRLMQRIMQ